MCPDLVTSVKPEVIFEKATRYRLQLVTHVARRAFRYTNLTVRQPILATIVNVGLTFAGIEIDFGHGEQVIHAKA